jgi:sortase family protein
MLRGSSRGTVGCVSIEVEAQPASASPPAGRRRFGWRTPVRWFGFGCLMGASFFAGYVVWLLWGTGLSTERAQQQLRAGVERSFDNPKPIAEAPPPDAPSRMPLGDAYAEIQIPSIGLDMIVVQGTDYESLKQGPGHYVDTADPWDLAGRVGIAGHRTTYLHPDHPANRLRPVRLHRHAELRPARGDGRSRARADAETNARAHHVQPEVRLQRTADRGSRSHGFADHVGAAFYRSAASRSSLIRSR